MATSTVEVERLHQGKGGNLSTSTKIEQGEMEDDDIFFTEEAFEMYSLSRLHENIRSRQRDGSRTVTRPRRGRNPSEKAKEKQLARKQTLKADQATPKVTKQQQAVAKQQQPKPKKVTPLYSLASPYPNLNYPTFSRLTIGQHKKFIELQAKYGSKGTRVTTSRESAELQHWRQLGAMIYQDQQDFNGFAEFAANQHSEVYMNMSPAAVKYVNDALKTNVERVLSLPQHYAVLQTFTLNPGVPLPSDPSLQRIGAPVFLGKVPELSVPGLDDKKVTLNRNPVEGEPVPKKNYNISEESNIQKLAQMHKADIVLSSSSLLTLVNNHAPLYDQQWEIPVEVKVNSDSSPHKVVCLQKPLMKHVYHPHEASALYHKFLLKRLLTGDSRDRYCQVLERNEDEEADQNVIPDITEECHLEQEERRGHLFPEEDFGDFGAASILDLETFGSLPPVVKHIEEQIAPKQDNPSSEVLKGDLGTKTKGESSLSVDEESMSADQGQSLSNSNNIANEEQQPMDISAVGETTPGIKRENDHGLRDDNGQVGELPMEVGTGGKPEGDPPRDVASENKLEAEVPPDASDSSELERNGKSDEQLEDKKVNVLGSDMASDGNRIIQEGAAKGEDVQKMDHASNSSNAEEIAIPSGNSKEKLIISGGEKSAEVPEKRVSRVVRMNVRSNSKSLSDEGQASDFDDSLEVIGQASKSRGTFVLKNLSVDLGSTRMRFSSESSSDDEVKLTIVTDSDLQSGAEKEVTRTSRKKHKIEKDSTCFDTTEDKTLEETKAVKMVVCETTTRESKLEEPMDAESKDNESEVPSDVGTKEKIPDEPSIEVHSQDGVVIKRDNADEELAKRTNASPIKKVKEVPVVRMMTRRSTRIRQQSSSEETTTDNPVEEIPAKRQRGRKKSQKQTDQQAQKEQEEDEEQGKGMKLSKDSEEAKQNGKVIEPSDENVEATVLIDDSEKRVGRRTRGSKKEPAVDKSQLNILTRSTRSTVSEISSDMKTVPGEQIIDRKGKHSTKQNVTEEPKVDLTGGQNVKSSSPKEQSIPTEENNTRQPLQGQSRKKTSPGKAKTSAAQGNLVKMSAGQSKTAKVPSAGASGKKSQAESTIDEIMRLQEKMLTRQKSGNGVAAAASTPQSQKTSPGHRTASGMQNQQQQTAEGLPTNAAGLGNEGMDLEDLSEGNYAYSLWKFGRLRLLVRSKSHGMLSPEGHQQQEGQSATVASVVTKMESQSELGLGTQTLGDFTRVWLNMYLRPGSKVMRGRIDSRTSEILSWECLDSSWIVQSQQLFNPAMCLKMLYHILVKLAGLSEGRYLLRHRPGDAHVCIYQCMEQAAKNVRASYDLHAAHQAAKLMTSLPPTMPWVPLDPNAPYASKKWQGRSPLTFPPCPPNFKHPSTFHEQHEQRGRSNKKKKRNKRFGP